MKNDFDNKVTKKILDRKLFNDDNTCRTLDCRKILKQVEYESARRMNICFG